MILGAGTMMVNKLAPVLSREEWRITIVDQYETHYYQPGFLFIPFGIYTPGNLIKLKRDFLPGGVEAVFGGIEKIEPKANRVLMHSGKVLPYDLLIVATGCKINPGETEGLQGSGWYRNIFDFYTIEGATALARFFKYWEGGLLVLSITEMSIKCPVAPLEFVFLADWWFTEQGLRDKVEIELVTPLDGAWGKPVRPGSFFL